MKPLDIPNKNVTAPTLVLYIIGFYLVWTLYSLFLSPLLGEAPLAITLATKIPIKLLVWTGSVFFLLKFVFKTNPIAYLRLNKISKKGMLYAGLISVCFIIYTTLRQYLLTGTLQFNLALGVYPWLSHILLVGLTEEVVFRGFLLQKSNELMAFKYANLLQALLFFLIHFPRWYNEGSLFSIGFMAGSAAFFFTFASIQAYLFKKTGSLWGCILVHSVNNLIAIAVSG